MVNSMKEKLERDAGSPQRLDVISKTLMVSGNLLEIQIYS